MGISRSASPLLSIILVSYNGWDWVEKCLRSFSHVSEWSADRQNSLIETILVDNASSDDTVAQVKKHFPWVTVIASPTNGGFAVGNNLGIQHATADFVMLLNTDAEFTPNTSLQVLLNRFVQQPKLAVLTPRVELSNGTLDHACHRGFPTPWNAFCYFSGIAKVLPWFPPVAGYRLSWKNLRTAHAIDACSGAAMIVRRSAMDTVGFLDESFFMYAEDIDWCYRFKQAGWEVWYDPAVKVIHHKHKSGLGKKGSWETKERTTRAFYDTMGQFFRKHYSHRTPGWMLIFTLFMIELLKNYKIRQERSRYDHS